MASWISFDPTIHAGHIFQAMAMLVGCTIIYCGVQNDIGTLKTENVTRKQEIAEVRKTADDQTRVNDARFERMVDAQNKQVDILRNDMKGWFLNLSDKLDKKADKR